MTQLQVQTPASPRERAEAAYITLKGELNNER